MQKIKITIISLITLFGLFLVSTPAKAQAADAKMHERPLFEDSTGEDVDSTENGDEPDFDERGIEELDPWFFEEDGKDANPAEKEIKEQKTGKEDRTRDLP